MEAGDTGELVVSPAFRAKAYSRIRKPAVK